MPERLPARATDDEERLSLYPLSFEEALKAALPGKVGTEDGGDDGD